MKPEIRAEISKLVVMSLERRNKQNAPTAKEIYYEIETVSPNLIRRGFKSFVKVMNEFPNIENIEIKGKPDKYFLKNK